MEIIIANLPFSGRTIARTISSRNKGDIDYYVVTCVQSCVNINIELRVDSGDADLFARADMVPKISSSNCDNCALCKARTGTLTDKCASITTPQSIDLRFFEEA